MNILLVNQFYPPDAAPTGQLLADVASALAARGHAVTVLCSAGGYANAGEGGESRANLRIVRLRGGGASRRGLAGAFLGYLRFHVAAYREARRLQPRPDTVLSLTTPPWIGLSLQRAVPDAAHVQWLMDLYPQVLAAHGVLGQGNPVYRGLARATRIQWLRSAALVTLGPGMSCQVRALLPWDAVPEIAEIPVWVPFPLSPWPEGTANPLRERRGWRDGETVFLYSGNMGRGHPVEPFLAAAAGGETPGARWAFAGGGCRQADVARFAAAHPSARIECLPYVGACDLQAHLCSADVHLISVGRGWAGLIVPSKLQAAFAVGRPVLFVGPPEGEPAEWIRASGGGWVVAPGDDAGLVKAVREGCVPAERNRRGEAALRFARQHFDCSANMACLVRALEAAADGDGRRRDRGS
jgi:glycosyltransferase involved in cell wall biosynthesis